MASSSGSGSRYLDPHRVFELIIRRKPCQLIDYLASIPGTSRDLHCHQVVLYARSILHLLSRPPRLRKDDEWRILWWAHLARFHATSSRFCAPQMVSNPPNCPSDADHYMHPHNSSSYSGRMLSHEPDSIELTHAPVHNQLWVSNSRIHAATFPPLRASSSDEPIAASTSRTPTATLLPLPDFFDDVHRHPAMHNQLSASSSRSHASMFPPLQANTIQDFAELSLGRPGSEQFTPQMLMQNTAVDVKGKGAAASQVDQIKAKILRLNVASEITPVAPRSTAAGVLIRDGCTAQFMIASCLRQMLYMDPALQFASACCEGIRMAVLVYEPSIIVLESHQVHLLEGLVATQSQASEVVQLDQLLGSNPPHFIIQSIPEEGNLAARLLALDGLTMEVSKMIYKDPPARLLPYLDQ